jgi:hypothetical protein
LTNFEHVQKNRSEDVVKLGRSKNRIRTAKTALTQ